MQSFFTVHHSEGKEKLKHINSKEAGQNVDVRHLFSLTETQLLPAMQPACPCALSRVNCVRVTKEKGPKGGVGPHDWTTTPAGKERTDMGEERGRSTGERSHNQQTNRFRADKLVSNVTVLHSASIQKCFVSFFSNQI